LYTVAVKNVRAETQYFVLLRYSHNSLAVSPRKSTENPCNRDFAVIALPQMKQTMLTGSDNGPAQLRTKGDVP
jgi:hypothetical protein